MTTPWHAREESDERILARALGYPYDLPESSYLLAATGSPRACTSDQARDFREFRTPVLAVGSNQSPDQLARKFPGTLWSAILSEQCVLKDFDTVYSAHIAAYGSIAAMLHPSPGTSVTLFVNWLDDEQLERMHETELGSGNYAFAKLTGLEITTEFGHRMDHVHFYLGNRGAIRHNDAPVPLAAVRASKRVWASMTQSEIQQIARQRTSPGHDETSFVLSSVSDDEVRTSRRDALMADSIPFEFDGLEILRR